MPFLVGPAQGFGGPTSEVFTTPFPHQPGEKGRDKDGNEYLFVEFITTNVFDANTYTFITDYLPGNDRDGMEHRNSTVMTSSGSSGSLATVRRAPWPWPCRARPTAR